MTRKIFALDQHPEKLPPQTYARFWCSTRFRLSLLLFFGAVAIYATRVNLSVGIVCMVDSVPLRNDSGSSWLPLNGNASDGQQGAQKFDWSKSASAALLGAFFWGYMSTQVIGGWLSLVIKPTIVILAAALCSALISAVSPVAAVLDYWLFYACRVFLGVCQGVFFPAVITLLSKWAPPMERSKLSSIAFAGNQAGNIICLAAAGFLCEKGFAGGWPSIFYSSGLVAGVWTIVWWVLGSSTPDSNLFISEDEKQYIKNALKDQHSSDDTEKSPFPWKSAFTSAPLWSAFIAHWAGDWAAYAMLTSMPTFMNDVLKISQSSLGLLSSLPYVAYFLGINISGFLADYLQSQNLFSTAMTRKLMTAIAFGGQGTFLIAAGVCGEGHVVLVTIFLTLGMGLSGFQYSGAMVNYMDIAPRFSGALFGIGNTIGSMAGIMAAAVMGAITADGTKEQWLLFFNLTDRILTISFILFFIFGKGEILPWARADMKQKGGNSKMNDSCALKTLADGIESNQMKNDGFTGLQIDDSQKSTYEHL